MLGFRKEICEGYLGGVSMLSQGKLLPVIARGFLAQETGPCMLVFCPPPPGGVLSAVKFLTPWELSG